MEKLHETSFVLGFGLGVLFTIACMLVAFM